MTIDTSTHKKHNMMKDTIWTHSLRLGLNLSSQKKWVVNHAKKPLMGSKLLSGTKEFLLQMASRQKKRWSNSVINRWVILKRNMKKQKKPPIWNWTLNLVTYSDKAALKTQVKARQLQPKMAPQKSDKNATSKIQVSEVDKTGNSLQARLALTTMTKNTFDY